MEMIRRTFYGSNHGEIEGVYALCGTCDDTQPSKHLRCRLRQSVSHCSTLTERIRNEGFDIEMMLAKGEV